MAEQYKDTFRLSAWVLPQEPLRSRLRELIDRSAKKVGTDSFPPHLTLFSTWGENRYKGAFIDAVSFALKIAASNTKRFAIPLFQHSSSGKGEAVESNCKCAKGNCLFRSLSTGSMKWQCVFCKVDESSSQPFAPLMEKIEELLHEFLINKEPAFFIPVKPPPFLHLSLVYKECQNSVAFDEIKKAVEGVMSDINFCSNESEDPLMQAAEVLLVETSDTDYTKWRIIGSAPLHA